MDSFACRAIRGVTPLSPNPHQQGNASDIGVAKTATLREHYVIVSRRISTDGKEEAFSYEMTALHVRRAYAWNDIGLAWNVVKLRNVCVCIAVGI